MLVKKHLASFQHDVNQNMTSKETCNFIEIAQGNPGCMCFIYMHTQMEWAFSNGQSNNVIS